MTYSISLSGHGADPQDVKAIFEDTIRALRLVAPDASSPVTGSLYATDDAGGNGIRVSAADVADVAEPADAEADPTAPEA